MCGIFGVVATDQSNIPTELVSETIERLFRLSQTRGTEASGLAVLSADSLRVLKEATSASSLIRTPKYKKLITQSLKNGHTSVPSKLDHPLAVIGHSRMVTNGSQEMHYNNQPVIVDGMIGIHNGIVVNVDSLWDKHAELERQYDVDSEVIFSLIRESIDAGKGVVEATCDAFSEIEGATTISGLFPDRECLLIATNNGSLYYCTNAARSIVLFASERIILKRAMEERKLSEFAGECTIEHVAPGTGCVVHLKNLETTAFDLTTGKSINVTEECRKELRSVEDLVSEGELNRRVAEPEVADVELIERMRAKYGYDRSFSDKLQRCTKCILPETMPFIEFDSEGVCSYCRNYNPVQTLGLDELKKYADSIRRTDGEYDCLVGLSGGRDSTYGLHYLKCELGLNPVAYTYDWGMVTDLARRNISRICGKLGVEHILVSADIPRKRSYIKKNVEAWLRKPHLGMIPLFMAGDKQYFYHAARLKRELNIDTIFLCENMLERTDFKSGFAGVRPFNADSQHVYTLPIFDKLKMLGFYGSQYLTNPGYLNASVGDTLFAYACYYMIKRDYRNLFNYMPWIEEDIISTLRDEYDWEIAEDTTSTWRIGDGTAAFYNMIYHRVAGFTENETFRSNQIREGFISREDGLRLAYEQNEPRYETVYWYCRTNGIDFENAVNTVMTLPRLKAPYSG